MCIRDSDCIDAWLKAHENCPNCKKDHKKEDIEKFLKEGGAGESLKHEVVENNVTLRQNNSRLQQQPEEAKDQDEDSNQEQKLDKQDGLREQRRQSIEDAGQKVQKIFIKKSKNNSNSAGSIELKNNSFTNEQHNRIEEPNKVIAGSNQNDVHINNKAAQNYQEEDDEEQYSLSMYQGKEEQDEQEGSNAPISHRKKLNV
eukprot:TRINITY_DN2936_c0_g1_i1.p1 TRINITY_DN2936_c0_g1~~TRINITY_DN2936_c0_g1_i1.p1  ORF type:complete len:221 (+),score=42.10 TRINITY_DN2936_c0_g1_i1:64-663(+)